MTYAEWQTAHEAKRDTLQKQLESEGLTPEQVIDYFDFDNMVEAQPDFCGLYPSKKKCHDIPKLNCYLCGCPHFRVLEPVQTITGKKVHSICSVNSKNTANFEVDNNVHCDCSNCTIPHTKRIALKYYKDINE